MLEKTVSNEKVPFIRDRCLLTLCGYLWLEKEITNIDPKETKRLDRYKRISKDHLVVEGPVILKEGHFVSCLEDRLHGTLLIDKKIDYIDFNDFLTHSIPAVDTSSEEISQAYKELAEKGLNESEHSLYNLIVDANNFSTIPMYWIVKDSDDNLIILYDYIENEFNFDDLIKIALRGYDFENMELTVFEESDSDFPTPEKIKQGNYTCGNLVLTDVVFNNQPINFKIYNLILLNKLLN